MKKILVFLFIITLNIPVYAERRIVRISQTGTAYRNRVADITYDNDGRMSQFIITYPNSSSDNYQYSYDGSTIKIDYYYDDCHDTNEFTVENGMVISELWTLDEGDYQIQGNSSYSYSDGHLSRIQTFETEEGETSMSRDNTWTWQSGNLVQMNGEDWGDNVYAYYQYNNMVVSPVMHALFGITNSQDINFFRVDEMYKTLAIFPFIGTLPTNLIESLIYYDGEKESSYKLTYLTDVNGDITTVSIITDNQETINYELSWEDTVTSSISSVINKQCQPSVSYNLKGQRKKNTDAKGLVICRFADGSVNKTIVQ